MNFGWVGSLVVESPGRRFTLPGTEDWPFGPTTTQLVVRGRIGRADGLALSERVRAMLGEDQAGRLECDVRGLVESDLGTVDALARLQLTARRLGGSVRLRNAPAELRELLALAGLGEVIPCSADSAVEVGRQPEQREELGGVEEEDDPADPIA
jgi:ABC-type transporter Mla MlaB component